MTTVRNYILEAHSATRRGSLARKALDAALQELDNSREITEKVTDYKKTPEFIHYGDTKLPHYCVEAHKARVVLDD